MSDYIPQEIQFRILKLLPVQSILRFRCVSKWWKEFIDSPTFLQEHLAVQKPHLLVECGETEFLVVDPGTLPPLVDTLRSPELPCQFDIFGTLHGVVSLYQHEGSLVLWNPSIRKFTSLPLPPDFAWTFLDAFLTCYGFWIDPFNKEFKIIIYCFSFVDDDKAMDVYGILYSSIRHDWSVIPPGEGAGKWSPLRTGSALIIGGVAHWRGWYGFRNDQLHTNFIMCYDFSQESFEFIEMNNQKLLSSPSDPPPRLCCWQGALSLVYCDIRYPYTCDLFSRQDGSWVHIFGFDPLESMREIFCPLDGMEERGRALAEQVQENPMVLAKTMDRSFSQRLVLYDTRAGCIPLTRQFGYIEVIYDFVESLLFPFE